MPLDRTTRRRALWIWYAVEVWRSRYCMVSGTFLVCKAGSVFGIDITEYCDIDVDIGVDILLSGCVGVVRVCAGDVSKSHTWSKHGRRGVRSSAVSAVRRHVWLLSTRWRRSTAGCHILSSHRPVVRPTMSTRHWPRSVSRLFAASRLALYWQLHATHYRLK